MLCIKIKYIDQTQTESRHHSDFSSYSAKIRHFWIMICPRWREFSFKHRERILQVIWIVQRELSRLCLSSVQLHRDKTTGKIYQFTWNYFWQNCLLKRSNGFVNLISRRFHVCAKTQHVFNHRVINCFFKLKQLFIVWIYVKLCMAVISSDVCTMWSFRVATFHMILKIWPIVECLPTSDCGTLKNTLFFNYFVFLNMGKKCFKVTHDLSTCKTLIHCHCIFHQLETTLQWKNN